MRVLIVDDDALMRELASFALSMDPTIEIYEADGGVAALALAADCQPDLVLLDMQMPDLDGAATFARLPSDMRVALMTATPEEAGPLIARGAVGVIPKPIDPTDFADRVRSFNAG
jgi:CheY-like chemotaxis protein